MLDILTSHKPKVVYLGFNNNIIFFFIFRSFYFIIIYFTMHFNFIFLQKSSKKLSYANK
jgi:hypothetical protein